MPILACTSTSFTRTGFENPPHATVVPCTAVVLERPPADHKYIELGFCTTSVPGGTFADNTPDAIRELRDCGCKNGGNAIVYHDEAGNRIYNQYGQTQVNGHATVLYVFPKDEGQSPAAPASRPVMTSVSERAATEAEATDARVTTSEDDLKGCTYVDRVDTSIACPASHPEGVACMAYRAKTQGGNTVLAQGAGKVYRCSSTMVPN